MKLEPAVLFNFSPIVPKNQGSHRSSVDWLAAAHSKAEVQLQPHLDEQEKEKVMKRIQKIVTRLGSSTNRIEYRYSALDDFLHLDWDRMKIFNLNLHPEGEGAARRAEFFAEVVNEAFLRFYSEVVTAPSMILHVTCTGYVSPSGAQRLVSSKNWGASTEVLHSYHMGCYASLPSIRIARGFLPYKEGPIDIVHTELCTLHMDPTQHSPDRIMMQSLFADGLMRYSVLPLSKFEQSDAKTGLEIVSIREEILPGTEEDMTWRISDHGMHMTISRSVPERFAESLEPFLHRLLESSEKSLAELKEEAVFAIHPGGPRIIDQIQEHLNLTPNQVAASNEILRQFGNMSSATLPHIWRSILKDKDIKAGSWIISVAFGPGLTLSGALMRKCGA
jgi:predicted naringenin-chalcone synthase